MDFKILGPIEVRTSLGRPIALGRRKQRVLLAALLLNTGKAIPSRRMLDWLWGERAPATAESNLYTYISALRKVLGSPPASRRAPTATCCASRPARSMSCCSRTSPRRGSWRCPPDATTSRSNG
ncbi:winged helix-turn-helix domain-containing protein [Nonomuraea thailandensis]